MAKRLNTELKFKKGGFKIKIGTTNRLNPNTVYIDLGGYIVPKEEKTEYGTDICELDKMFNSYLKKELHISKCFDKKYICVIETAQDRMKKGKTSYISLQCHLKQNNNLNVNEIIDKTKEFTDIMANSFNAAIEYNGFSVKN